MTARSTIDPYFALAPAPRRTKIISPHNVRFIQRDIRLRSYRSLFAEMAQTARAVCKSQEGRNRINILKLLDRIIPFEYFGTKRHRKLFYNIVKLMLTRSVHECLYTRQLIRGFNVTKIPWLAKILKPNTKALCQRHLYEAQNWLLEKIVKPVVVRIYAPVRKGQTHEIELVPKQIWMSYQKKVFNNLERMGHLVRTFELVLPRGILQIRPKSGYHDPSAYRPIMRLTPERCSNQRGLKERYRKICKTIRAAAEQLCLTKTSNLYCHWKNYVSMTEGQKIYGVKLDVKDAFGNIKIDFLCYILETQCQIGRIPANIKNLITHHIQNQFVTTGTTKAGAAKVWQWNHGLLQGDRFSSALCQLYMSYFDAIYLDKFTKPTTFIHRTVDDYFFCSTTEDEIHRFIQIMSSIHTLNSNKTQSNLSTFGDTEIGYCGQIFVMKTKEVRGLYDFKKRTEIRHRFRFWNMQRPIYHKRDVQKTIEEFLTKPMMLTSNTYHFRNMELNTVFNTNATVMQNYFESMIFLAFKFDASVMAVYCRIRDYSLLPYIIKRTAYKYALKAVTKLEQNKGQYYSKSLSVEAFLKVGVQAFILVLKKRIEYRKHKILDCLMKYMVKIYIKHALLDWKNFKRIPKILSTLILQKLQRQKSINSEKTQSAHQHHNKRLSNKGHTFVYNLQKKHKLELSSAIAVATKFRKFSPKIIL